MSGAFSHGYALLIGVGESAYPKWSLPVTVKDMQALRAILTDPALCGYPDDDAHIRLLHDAEATKQAILDGLAWLARQAAADSDATAVVFYSGHGWLADGSGKYYLLPHDVEPFDLAGSALPAEAFTAALRQVVAKRLLVFVDSCHAAGMATAKGQPAMKLPSGFTEIALPKGLVEELKQGTGRAVFSSSIGTRQSWVRPDGSLSLYTYHLIEALKGAGNQPGDTAVRVSNLMSHLGKAVPESARTLCHAEQIPFFDTATEDFSVALLLGGKGLSGAGFSPTQGGAAPQPSIEANGERSVAADTISDSTIVAGDHNVVQQGKYNINIGPTICQGSDAEAIRAALRKVLTPTAEAGTRGAGSEPTLPMEPEPEHIEAYLEAVRKEYSRVEMRPYPMLSELPGAPLYLALLSSGDRRGVYVPLRFDLQPWRVELAIDATDGIGQGEQDLREVVGREQPSVNVPLTEVLKQPGHIIFVGGAGSGKTTILRLVMAVLATRDPGLANGWLGLAADNLPLPVFVALGAFDHACQTAPGAYQRDIDSLLRYLDDHFAHRHGTDCVPKGFLASLVRSGVAWVLLDALDEVADPDDRIAVRQMIEQTAEAFPGNRLLVTVRTAAYASSSVHLDECFRRATVRELTRDQWAPMIEHLCVRLEADPTAAAERCRRLLAQIDEKPFLQEMVKTPVLVWNAMQLHFGGRELPEQRAELYDAYVDLLLGERLHQEEGPEAAKELREARWSPEERRLYLNYSAYEAHRLAASARAGARRATLTVVDEDDLVQGILAPFIASSQGRKRHEAQREAHDFVRLMAERNVLLQAQPKRYTFGDHLPFEEFLAASYMVRDRRRQADWLDFLGKHVGDSWWREVFLLTAGLLAEQPREVQWFLLEELGKLPGAGDAHTYGLAWAGRALLEIPSQRGAWRDAARDELAARLAGVLAQNPPETSVAARVEAGDVLGSLGDPRFIGKYRLPQFISIPGGTFSMGSTEAEVAQLVLETGKKYCRDELPRHQVVLRPFALARYPTTNAMFNCFAAAGGYADKLWWREAIEARKWGRGRVMDMAGKRDLPAYWTDGRLNGPSQPVVGVTWYEAVAYCRWLTAMLHDGHIYRLPSEAEWERAARGPAPTPVAAGEGAKREQRYPWGDDWAEGRANSRELHLERTTPVGIFPDGASAEGVLDLPGNVTEWCQDCYADDTYEERSYYIAQDPIGPPSGKYRVLRGGSSYDDRRGVRCAYRVWYAPEAGHDNFGFRVARMPSREAIRR